MSSSGGTRGAQFSAALVLTTALACGGADSTGTKSNPVPIVTTLSPSSVDKDTGTQPITVFGSGFVPLSEVRVNASARPTSFASSTELTATLSDADVATLATLRVDVLSPAPGGGTSNAVSLPVRIPVPHITFLPSQGAHAGRSGFSLSVHGKGFVSQSVVEWNGAPRPTQFVSSTRLTADIAAADIASVGTALVSVVNPSPGGGASGTVTVTIRAMPSASVTSSQSIPLHASDLVVDDARGLIYLAIGPAATSDTSSVVALDPNTLVVTKSVYVGNGLGRLARSDDGQYLYVGVDGEHSVRRVDVATFIAGLHWSLASYEIAGEIKVLPGHAGSVAVSRQNPSVSPPLDGVGIYDNGIPRVHPAPGFPGGTRIEFLEGPDTLYSFDDWSTGFEFYTIAITPAGGFEVFATGGMFHGFYTQITGASGRMYGTDGSIVDAGRRLRLGAFATGANSVAVDPVLGRAFLLVDGGIDAYDLNSFEYLGSVPVSGVNLPHPAVAYPHLIRWGADGLAFLDSAQVFLIRSPLFAP